MNYLVVVAHPDDEVLGAGATIHKLVREGHKVAVAIMSGHAAAKAEPLGKREIIDDPKIKMFLVKDIYGSMKEFFNIHKRIANLQMVRAVVHQCDCVIIRAVNSDAIKIIRQQKKPYLIEVVACPWDSFWNHGWKGKILAIPKFLSARIAIRNAEWVLYVTEQFLQRRYPTKGKSIGVSDVSIVDTDEGVLWRRKQKIERIGKKMVLGTAAGIDVQYKVQDYVIRAMGKLKSQGCMVDYELAGSGDGRRLKRIAKECGVLGQVRFVGELTHDGVLRWMDSVDVYIQPSLLEGLPRALVEAMSRGLPAIASRVGGIPELLDDEMLFKPKSVDDIAAHIRMFHKEVLMKSAKRNYDRARMYHKDFLDDRRDHFYKEFIERAVTQPDKNSK